MRRITVVCVVIALSLGAAVTVQAVEAPPEGIHPSEFATHHHGCLGPLRSKIARGDFSGVGPFGEHFTGDVNPGVHQGTVGEEEFLREVLGIEDIEAFCDGFE